MKKVLIFILALTMLLSMAACGKTENKDDAANNDSAADSTPTVKPEDNAPTAKPEDDAPAADDETGEETPDEPSEPDIDVDVDVDGPAADPNEAPAEPDMPAVEPDMPAVDEPAVDEPSTDEPATDVPAGETLGTILKNDFIARAEADSSLSAEDMANAIISNPAIQFGPATMPVEPGFLMGFDNAEITGFSQGVMFAPMIGSIPFVGYVFILEDGADVQAFLDTLNANANPRWNICVTADETVSANVGNMVFFVMCPASIEG